MNCRPGDLAVFVRGENAGRMVRVLAPSALQSILDAVVPGEGHWWDVTALCRIRAWENGKADRPETTFQPGQTLPAPDRWLRPIRDPGDDATDETLVWAGKPHREHA